MNAALSSLTLCLGTIVFGYTSQAFSGTCPKEIPSELIRSGSRNLDQRYLGVRVWSLNRVVSESKAASLNLERDCFKKIAEQAFQESTDYWKKRKVGCEKNSVACSIAEQNLNYIERKRAAMSESRSTATSPGFRLEELPSGRTTPKGLPENTNQTRAHSTATHSKFRLVELPAESATSKSISENKNQTQASKVQLRNTSENRTQTEGGLTPPCTDCKNQPKKLGDFLKTPVKKSSPLEVKAEERMPFKSSHTCNDTLSECKLSYSVERHEQKAKVFFPSTPGATRCLVFFHGLRNRPADKMSDEAVLNDFKLAERAQKEGQTIIAPLSSLSSYDLATEFKDGTSIQKLFNAIKKFKPDMKCEETTLVGHSAGGKVIRTLLSDPSIRETIHADSAVFLDAIYSKESYSAAIKTFTDSGGLVYNVGRQTGTTGTDTSKFSESIHAPQESYQFVKSKTSDHWDVVNKHLPEAINWIKEQQPANAD